MPKESKTFNGFAGGINLDRDESDIRDDNQGKDELPICEQGMLDELGRIHFSKYAAQASNGARVAGYDVNADRLLIQDGNHYLQTGVYKLGNDINWGNSTEYRPEVPINGKFNPLTPSNTSNGIDIKLSINDEDHVVVFSGVSSSFNDGTTGIICGKTSASADDMRWGTTNNDGWAPFWFASYFTHENMAAADASTSAERKTKRFEALWSGDMTQDNKSHDSSTNGGAGDGGYWASLNQFNNNVGLRTGVSLTNSVIGGDAAIALTNIDSFAFWQMDEADDHVCATFRLGGLEHASSTYPDGGYGQSLKNIEAHDLYVELQVKDVENFERGIGFGVSSRTNHVGMRLDPGTTGSYDDNRGWWLDATTISKKGAILEFGTGGSNNFRVFKLPYEAAARTHTAFNPSGVCNFVCTYDTLDSSTYDTSDNTNKAVPRVEIKDIRFIPQGDNFNWNENNYTFFQTTIKNGIESLPFRYRDIPQAGASLNNTPYSFLYGVNASHNLTLYKPAASGDAGRIYYQELDENQTIKGSKFLLAEYDYDLGVRWADSDDFLGWTTTSMTHKFENPPVTSTYTFESGYPEGTTSCNALFKHLLL